MKPYVFTLWSLFFAIPMSAQDQADSTATNWERQLELKEVVVMASRTVVKQAPDRIIYLTKNDQYAKGMNGIEVLDRIPRVSVVNDMVTVAGKSSVKYNHRRTSHGDIRRGYGLASEESSSKWN